MHQMGLSGAKFRWLLAVSLAILARLHAVPAQQHAYVANSSGAAVSVIDLGTNAVISTLAGRTRLPGSAVHPESNRLYLANTADHSLTIMIADTYEVVATLRVGTRPHQVAVNPEGTLAYVTNSGSDDVSVIDAVACRVIDTIPVGHAPEGIAVHPSGARVYVANRGSNTLSVIDTQADRVIDTVAVGQAPSGVASDGSGMRLYVANAESNTVSVIDAGSNTELTRIEVGANPRQMACDTAGSRLYVVNRSSNTVSVIDTALNAVIATVGVGNQPTDIVFEQADPRETSSLKLVNGLINGQAISPPSRTITVSSGASISGQFTVLINSTFSPNATMAMGLTPSWGTHATSFTALAGFVNPITDQARIINLSLTAPTLPGTYYITATFNTEFTADQVISCTDWTVGAPVWDNGDDVADWTPAIIAEANANGRALVNYLFPPPFRSRALKVPATAVIVNVVEPASTTSTTTPFDTTTTVPGTTSTTITPTTTSTTITTTTTTSGVTTTTVLMLGSPRGLLDTPLNNAVVSGTITCAGWAAIVSGNQAGVASRVELWVDGLWATQLNRGISRPDVQQYFAAQGVSAPDNLGFSGPWDSRTVADGAHQISIRAADAAGVSRELLSEIASLTMVTGNGVAPSTTTSTSASTTTTLFMQGSLRGSLDAPTDNSVLAGDIPVAGWAAIVSGSQASITARVELLIDGRLVGQLDRGVSRPDVQQYFAAQGIAAPANLGFYGQWNSRTVADGAHRLAIRAADGAGASLELVSEIANISIVTSNGVATTTTTTAASSTTITTTTTASSTTTTLFMQASLRGVLEVPVSNAVVAGSLRIQGWAAVITGNESQTASLVELWVDGLRAGALGTGIVRLDVQQALARQGISAPEDLGFSGQWDSRLVADGTHQISIRAADDAGVKRELAGEIARISIVVANGSSGSTTTTTTGNSTTTTLPGGGSRLVRVACGNAMVGGTYTVPIELVAQGDENALGFSLTFDPTVLSNPQATWGSDATGVLFNVNASQAAQGRFGIALALPVNQTFPAGVRQIVVATFTVIPGSSATGTYIGFGNAPIVRQVSNADAQAVPAAYQGCSSISIIQGYEADVVPRPTGKNDGTIAITDWVQVCRFATALDIPASGGEFQRADCAPRQLLGDGQVTITDCVQAGRYAAGLDPATPAGGPAAPAAVAEAVTEAAGPRMLRPVSATFQRGQAGSLSLELDSMGDENALGFSLSFDPSLLSYDSAALGSGAGGAMLMVNNSQAAAGQLGIALALPAGQRFAPGVQQLVTVRFKAAAGSTAASTQIRFADQPIRRQVSDPAANPLSASYGEATVTFAGESQVTLYFPQVADGGGYTTSVILGNPLDSDTTVRLDFFADDGSPLGMPIGGAVSAFRTLSLSARGVARVTSDGTSAGIKAGWLRATSPAAIGGQAIFQTAGAGRIVSEAGVAPAPLALRLMTYIESSGAAATGLAIANPNNAPVAVTLKLRTAQGAVAASASLNIPALGHTAQFVTQWFGGRFAQFEGSLEILASSPVSAVALRYDNPGADVFTTLPLIVVP